VDIGSLQTRGRTLDLVLCIFYISCGIGALSVELRLFREQLSKEATIDCHQARDCKSHVERMTRSYYRTTNKGKDDDADVGISTIG
jgi:hypothetical protein